MKIINIFLILMLLISCKQENDLKQQNLKLVSEWLDAFANNDFNKFPLIMSPDVVVYGLGGIDSMSLPQVMDKMNGSANLMNYSPFFNQQWHTISKSDSVFSGEGVLFWGTSTLNFKNGDKASFPIHIVTMTENNKIKSMYFYYDLLNIRKDIENSISKTNNK